jgi:dTDP-4-amino-4,6-dideoxygalactose transaminase
MKKRIIKYGGSLAGFPEWWALVKSVTKSVWTGNWQTGPETALFEKELAEDMGVKHAVMTSSGSCAALLALASLELPKGSEVIIPAVTFPTVFNIIPQCGLIPVVVDCDPLTNNIDLHKLEEAISKKTKAIIAVHILGNPVDMPRLMEIAKKHQLIVVEDNCDGYGTTIGGKMAGSFGDISFTSTHAAHIITTGVGGVVFTNDDSLMEKVRMYRDWGRQSNTTKKNEYKELPKDYNPRFIYEKIGYNFQILELQSAMGRVQLRKAKKIKLARWRNWVYLSHHLRDLHPIRLAVHNTEVCWFALPLVSKNRGELVAHLEKHGIETRSMMSGDITKHPAYKDTEYRIGNELSGADFILKNSFWVSVHPSLTKKDLKYIVKVFKDFFNGKA